MGIFGKSEPKPAEPTPRPVPAAAPAPAMPAQAAAAGASPKASVIGPRAIVKGELLGDDDIVVDGLVEGTVRISRELRIGTGGRVLAGVHAASVIVSGELIGNCSATQRIEIQATGRLTGDIRAPRITIAEGATFKGRSETGRVVDKAPPSPVAD
jgi:cytoskeletal protein CcmA (bactofilin family)